jgi:hypothetical protein
MSRAKEATCSELAVVLTITKHGCEVLIFKCSASISFGKTASMEYEALVTGTTSSK